MSSFPRASFDFDVMSRAFAREQGMMQGAYRIGGRPTLYDPKWMRQRVPAAILRHEEIHQQLAQNTSHGIFTLILTSYARVANARKSLEACGREDGIVQEMGATYAELACVQRISLEHCAASIESLPSVADGRPPYREAFDFARWLLPLEDAARHERFDPRTLVIGALCSCSMNTPCLRYIAESGFDDDAFAAWLTKHSPNKRLEQIAMAAGPASFREMKEAVATLITERMPTLPMVRELFDRLSASMLSHAPTLAVERIDELEQQARAAVVRLQRDCPEFEFDVEASLRPTGPLFTDAIERRKQLGQQSGFEHLVAGN